MGGQKRPKFVKIEDNFRFSPQISVKRLKPSTSRKWRYQAYSHQHWAKNLGKLWSKFTNNDG